MTTLKRFLCLAAFLGIYFTTFAQNIPRPITDTAAFLRSVRRRVDSIGMVMKATLDVKQLANLYLIHGTGEDILKNLDTAIYDYTKALTLNPDLKSLYYLRGRAYDREKNYDKAVADYQTSVVLCKDNPRQLAVTYNALGNLNVRLKNFDKAIDECSAALELNPMMSLAYFNRALGYYAKKQYQQAIDDCTASSMGFQNNKRLLSEIFLTRADSKKGLKKYTEALNDYALAIEANPNNRVAYWNRAGCYWLNGDYELADKQFTKVLNYYKSDSVRTAILYDDRANMEINEQKYGQALRDDSVALTYNGKYAVAYWNRANAYAQNADFQLSIDAYKRAADYYHNDNSAMASIYDAIANNAYFLADYEQVVKSSTSAIGLNDQLWSSYLSRGRAYLKKGEKELAMNDFNKVLKLDTFRRTYEYAFVVFYTGDPGKAVQLMQANIISTTEPVLLMSHYYNLACLYSLMNKPDDANAYLKKCIDGGYSKKYAKADPDLENIRDTKDFKEILGIK